jgi:hypothetical protein
VKADRQPPSGGRHRGAPRLGSLRAVAALGSLRAVAALGSLRAVAAAAVGAAALTACVPLFVPPVPIDVVTPAPAWRVAGSTELRAVRDGEGRVAWLRLRLRFDEVPAPAWVAVQWFGPAGGERASGSWWVEPSDVGRVLTWDTPADVELSPGTWRAVVSVGDRLLRQLDVVVESAVDAPAP